MRGADRGRGTHFPFRIIPDRGQILQDCLNPCGEKPRHVFNDDIPRPDFFNESRVFMPQPAPCPFRNPFPFPRQAHVLAREAPAQYINRGQIRPRSSRTSSYMGMPGQCRRSTERQKGSTSQKKRCFIPAHSSPRSHSPAPEKRLPTVTSRKRAPVSGTPGAHGRGSRPSRGCPPRNGGIGFQGQRRGRGQAAFRNARSGFPASRSSCRNLPQLLPMLPGRGPVPGHAAALVDGSRVGVVMGGEDIQRRQHLVTETEKFPEYGRPPAIPPSRVESNGRL